VRAQRDADYRPCPALPGGGSRRPRRAVCEAEIAPSRVSAASQARMELVKTSRPVVGRAETL
jgi:hypothetical protein